jgi:hypothetical protein
MKLFLLPLALLSGCTAIFGDLSRYDPNSQAFKQCSYEAKVATPSSLGVIEAVARERELTDMCMKGKGY